MSLLVCCLWYSFVIGQDLVAPQAFADTSGCVSDQTEDIFLWTEWPGSYDAAGYYTKLLAFMQQNCIGARVSRLVLRVLHPEFPSDAESIWWPPSPTTPFYANLLSLVNPGTVLVVYPYLMEEAAGRAWSSLSPGGSHPVEGVFEFVSRWNTFLAAAGSSVRLSSVVFDLEENGGLRGYSGFEINADMARSMKTAYPGVGFEVTTGFDVLSKIAEPAFDKVYGQFYDFYAPKIFAAQSETDSPFLLHKDDSEGIADYIINEAIPGNILNRYGEFKDKLLVMWSNQNIGDTCIYGDGSARCGINYEFGSWNAQAFNSFLKTIRGRNTVFASLSHGIFQFSFMPSSWCQ
jgi:hypothetical protein